MTFRCEVCAKPLPPEARHDRKYCDQSCERVVINARKRDRLREARSGRACEFCGHPVPDELKKGTKYCSPACRNAFRYGRALDRLAPRACDACGKRFEPFSPDQRHCCGECAWVTRRGGAWLDPRPCGHCGKVFRPRRAEYGRYCSMSCAGKAVGARQPILHPPKPCEWCGTTYKPRRAASRFCSLSCAGKGNLAAGAIRQNLDPRRRLLVQRGIILRPITAKRFDAVWARQAKAPPG